MKALIEKLQSGLDPQSSEIGYAVVLLLSDEIEDEKKVEFVARWWPRGKCRQPETDSGLGNNRSEARPGRDQRREWICRRRTGPRFE
jgi:hypothetical protein